MGYLDYAGLQYLWGKLKEKFAPKSHSHDDRYYTEAEVNSKLSGKVDNTEAGANGLINKLESGTAAPVDDDLIITQWANHTTATAANQNKYVRRPMSSIWSYIKTKADSVYQPKGSYLSFQGFVLTVWSGVLIGLSNAWMHILLYLACKNFVWR